MPEKLGAEPKKVAVLVLLVVAAGVIYFRPSSTGPEEPTGASKASAPGRSSFKQIFSSPQTAEVSPTPSSASLPPSAGKAATRDFRPSMKRKPGAGLDPENFDPTLRMDLLRKVATVHVAHVERSLFGFYTPPVVTQPVIMIGPEPPPPPPPPVVTPPPPPITLRFFGNIIQVRGGGKKVFCGLNDQVMIPSEGEVLQHRYKIKKILQAAVLVEDLQNHHEQTLPIDKQADK